MQMSIALLTLVLAAPTYVVGAATGQKSGSASNAAVQKVIQMLQDMQATAKKEKHEEEVKFADFETFCTHEIADLKESIATAAEQIELLTSEIGKLTSDVAALGEEIAKLQSDVASFEADVKAQTAQREKEYADFVAESTDYGESIDAIDRALVVLTKNAADKKQAAASLLQVSELTMLPERVKAMVSAFMAIMDSDEDGQAPTPPEANAYENQSGGIVDMLKNLQDDFRKKAKECEKAEMNAKHAYDMIIQDLTDSISRANSDIEEKTAEKEKKNEKIAEDKSMLASTITDKDQDTKTLSDLEAECSQKAESFKEKQQLRAEEIEAIGKAIEILQSGAVSGAAEKHLDFIQQVSSLIQVAHKGKGSSAMEHVNHQIRDFLAGEANRLHSRRLGLLAEKLAADPFAKVKKLIDDMITRLLEEANAEAEQKGFCDKELGTNKITRDKLTSEIDELDAAIEEGKAFILKLTEDIATLTKEIAELDAAVEEATALREEEKAKNALTIKEAKEAQDAVQAATAVLKEFYAKAAQATALVQTAAEHPSGIFLSRHIKIGSDDWQALANPNFKGTVDKGHKEGMQTFGETYKGQQDEAGGVLAMLEVIMSDFANVESETMANEAQSQKAYEDFMTDSKKTKAVKSKNIEMFTADKVAAESKLQTDTKDIKATQDELLAADRYFEKLKPQCIDAGVSYEERVAAREAEIESLKQALEILSSTGPTTSE
jgi:DNA repair exonuclease SbcCD ATPase subunit